MSEVEQLKVELFEQKLVQKRLFEQIQNLTVKLNEQTVNVTKFNLTPAQIIRNFNEIPPFSGEDSYKLKSFLKTIEDCEKLCGENNNELKCYCLTKIVNNKIIGSARNAIMEIPEHQRNWYNVEQQLRTKFRPKHTVHQLLFQAKDLKVHNLKDLFNKLNRIKSECSEICDFEDEDIFTYTSIDKEIVQILISKLVPIAQLQINTKNSLFELENLLCQSEIYLSEEIIKNEYKIHKKDVYNKNNFTNRRINSNHNSNQNSNQNSNHNSNNNNFKKNENNIPNFQYRFRKDYNNNHFNNNNHNNNNYGHNNFNNNGSGQYKRHFENRNGQFDNRTRQYRNTFTRQEPTPMEVDNINEELNHEVNFIEVPPPINSR